MDTNKITEDLNSVNPYTVEKAMAEVSKEYFAMENPGEVKDLMLFAMISLLLDKGIFSEQEFKDKVEESTAYFKLMKLRAKNQNTVV